MRRGLGLLVVGALAAPAFALGAVVEVFYDLDGDGRRSAAEVGAPQVLVSDGDRVYRTDADGKVEVEVFRARGEAARLFVIVPGGHLASTPWHRLLDPGVDEPQAVAFGLRPVASQPAAAIAVTADPQVVADDARAVGQALLSDLCPPSALPALVVVLGDLTEHGTALELVAWRAAMASAPVPVYACYGSRDGAGEDPVGIGRFEQEIGPAWYAFWSGGRCYMALVTEPDVLTGRQQARQVRWFRRLLAAVPDGAELVLLGHVPPARTELEQARERHRVAAVCYGHWHENNVWWSDGVPMVATGPYRGGEWGAGTGSFRRVTFGPDGVTAPVVTAGVRHLLEVLAPSPVQPAERLQLPVRVAAYDSRAEVAAVEAALAGGQSWPLRRAGQVTWRLDLPAVPGGELTITARTTTGDRWSTRAALPAPEPTRAVALTGPPPEPPLVRAWLASTGGRWPPEPIGADGRLYLPAPNDDLPNRSAVVCLDADTGREVWRTSTLGAVRRPVVVSGGRVFALTAWNQVQAFAAGGGEEVWRTDLVPGLISRHRSAHTGLTVWQGRVLAQVGGGPLVALDAASGSRLGEVAVAEAYHAGPSAAAEQVVVPGLAGLTSLDAGSLAVRWRTAPGLNLARHGPVTLGGLMAFVVGSDLAAVDLLGGAVRWRQPFPSVGLRLGGVAFDDGVVYTPGPRPVAYRATTGGGLWPGARPAPGPAPGTPAVAGRLVWATGDDGSLAAYDRADGQMVWRTNLGLSLKSGPVVVGSTVFVADADGNVHALVPQGGS